MKNVIFIWMIPKIKPPLYCNGCIQIRLFHDCYVLLPMVRSGAWRAHANTAQTPSHARPAAACGLAAGPTGRMPDPTPTEALAAPPLACDGTDPPPQCARLGNGPRHTLHLRPAALGQHLARRHPAA